MQLKKTSKKKSLINEIRIFSNGYFSINNIDGDLNISEIVNMCVLLSSYAIINDCIK